MPSTISFAEPTSHKSIHTSIYDRTQQRKKKMNVTQTYFLAHSARGKLSREAARGDHNLRLLVGHANMLDSLMLDLAHAEEEQEQWLTRSVSVAREERAIPHTKVETIQESEAEWEAESTDDESDISEDDQQAYSTYTTVNEIDSDLEEEDDEEEEELSLFRTTSRHSPPELSADADSDSDDDDAHMPSSPPSASPMMMTEKERQALAPLFEIKDNSLPTAEVILSSMQQPTIIAAY